MKHHRFTHEFVELMPGQLQEGVLYVSMEYATAIHRCACGCGEKVVTPMSPTDWSLQFDGDTISLSPSIGNWNFACRSHYWIERGRVRWAAEMSQQAIELGRTRDRQNKARYFGAANPPPQVSGAASPVQQPEVSRARPSQSKGGRGLWSSLKEWWKR
ncbi:DUF6527 family protein [Pseudomonas sp. P5_A2_2]